MVVVEGNKRSLLHVSSCSPVNFIPSGNDETPTFHHQLSEMRGACFLTVGNLTTGRSYAFKVRAHNAIGWGPFSKVEQTNITPPTDRQRWDSYLIIIYI
jgi:hypothetical protein